MTVFNGYLALDSRMFVGDYTTSPSDVYYAVLQSNGEFVISRGSNPSISDQPVWASGVPKQNLGGFFDHMQGDGNFVVYTSQNGLDQGTVVPVFATNTGGAAGNYFASLNDSGQFAVYSGTNPDNAGKQLYSNKFNDPVTGISISSIQYNLAGATITSDSEIHGSSTTLTNNTPTTQVYPVSLSLSYTKTNSWNWNLAEAVTLGVKSTTQIGIPGIGQESTEISLSETTTLSSGEGGSTSQSVTFTGGNTVTVPPGSVYTTQIIAQQLAYNIDYTFTGVASYKSGASADVTGSGEFIGDDSGQFQIVTDCVSTPGGCPGFSGGLGAIEIQAALPIPEPSSVVLLLPAVVVAAAIAIPFDPVRRRRAWLIGRYKSSAAA